MPWFPRRTAVPTLVEISEMEADLAEARAAREAAIVQRQSIEPRAEALETRRVANGFSDSLQLTFRLPRREESPKPRTV